MAIWCYAPRSGARWIGEAGPRDGLAVVAVEWFHHSVHVVAAQAVQVYAAAPGGWWRDAAREAAEQVALRVRGLALDDRGAVSLIVPRVPGVAALARFVLWAVEPSGRHDDQVVWALARSARLAGSEVSRVGPPDLLEDLRALAQDAGAAEAARVACDMATWLEEAVGSRLDAYRYVIERATRQRLLVAWKEGEEQKVEAVATPLEWGEPVAVYGAEPVHRASAESLDEQLVTVGA